MIAALPMYDWPELAGATNALWQELAHELRACGIDAPDELSRSDDDTSFALADDLLLGQTCGYPLSTRLKGKVQYLATPEYNVEGCDGPLYSSALLVHKSSRITLETTAGSRFAYNSENSLSGYRCIRAIVGDPAKHFGAMVHSGTHRQSAEMVATGLADVAALDAICWHHLKIIEPNVASKLKIIGWTKLRPGLPFITSLKTPSDKVKSLRDVLIKVTSNADANSAWQSLAIGGCAALAPGDYDDLAGM